MEDTFTSSDRCDTDGYARKGQRKSVVMKAASLALNSTHTIRRVLSSFRQQSSSQDGDSTVEDATDQARLYAQYNGVVFGLIALLLAIAVAVYFVLEPFLHPLLWALLAGTVLFPFKKARSHEIEEWLEQLETSGVPLTLAIFLSPFSLFNYLTSQLGDFVDTRRRILSVSVISVVLFYTAYHFNMLSHLHLVWNAVVLIFEQMDTLLSTERTIQLVALLSGQVVVVGISLCMSHPDSFFQLPLRATSICMWFLILANLASYLFGIVGLQLLTVLYAIGGTALINSRGKDSELQIKDRYQETVKRQPSIAEQVTETLLGPVKPIDSSVTRGWNDNEEPEVVSSSPEPNEDSILQRKVWFTTPQHSPAGTMPDPPTIALNDHEHKKEEDIDGRQFLGRGRRKAVRQVSRPEVQAVRAALAKQQSNQLFLLLITCCSVVVLWQHPLFLLPIIPMAVWNAITKLYIKFPVISSSLSAITTRGADTLNKISSHSSMLFPQPLPTFYNMYLSLDKWVLHKTKDLVGSLVSGCMIAGLLVGAVGCCVLLVIQIQIEVTSTVGLTVNVLNNSVTDSPWLMRMIGDANNVSDFKETMSQFTEKGFHQSRDWLATHLKDLVGKEHSATVVQQILHTYDNLYQSFVLQNSTQSHTSLSTNDISSWLTATVDYGQSITMVLKSLWSLFSFNMSIALSVLTAASSFIFSGGTILFNFVIFNTTLFYLLIYSEQQYLPVQWASEVLSTAEDDVYTEAFSRVIRSVFHASIRRAVFYGLYCWLVLSVFGQPIVFLPSVLAALAGAVPFVGPYWVSLPAVLQLWLVEGSPLAAILVLLLFLFPSLVIDSLINSEIEGGHPYLTGLAIVGGIYFHGLEGAIIGPILLCCLLFPMNFLPD